MLISNIDFPDAVIDALHERRLVVFAGAGVSMDKPACLPNFKSLTESIAKGTGKTQRNGETFEQFLGRLQDQDVKVHVRAKRRLDRDKPEPTDLHQDLLRLYPKDGPIRLVTTNFDLLFEHAVDNLLKDSPEVFRAPALPLGNDFEGIVHVHGSVSVCQQMVLTDKDFGQAYLTEGWARRFLVDLFNSFVILFVGYRHEDTAMNYLARALPGQSEDKRFIFTGSEAEKKPEQWSSLGLNTIVFPQKDGKDYSELYAAIHELAERVQRRVVEWKQIIETIASNAPPTDRREADLIKYALADKVNTQFFANTASNPKWLEWLDEHGLLDALFKHDKLKERDRILSRWLSDKFAINNFKKLFLLIGEHNMQLHPRFWDHLAWKIGARTDSSLSPTVLSCWISLLLSAVPREGDTPDGGYILPSNRLYSIGKLCIQLEKHQDLLMIFDAMIQCRLQIRYGYHLPGDESGENLQFNWESASLGKFEELDDLWEEGLKPNLPLIVHPLLDRVIRRLEDLYFTFRAWGGPDTRLEPASEGRDSIEPHERNVREDVVDILIDSARDCLEHLTESQPEVAAQWCERLAHSESRLLQRLAVHVLSKRRDLSPDETLRWLLTHFHCDLHEHSLQYELFSAVRQNYRSASLDCRESLIAKVQEFRALKQDNSTNRELDAKFHLDWIHWIFESYRDCPLVIQAREDILTEFPHLKPSPHPDRTSWIQSDCDNLPPLTDQQLLNLPASDSPNVLLSYEIDQYSETIRQNFDRSMQFADELAADGKWNVYPWRALIQTWANMELDLNRHSQVLGWLERPELYSEHSREIANALYLLVKKDGPSYAPDLRSRANRIAQALWTSLDKNVEVDPSCGWYKLSADYAVRDLVTFWISSVSLWRNNQNPQPTKFSDEYQQVFSDFIYDPSHIGRLTKSVLAANLPLMLAVDKDWTHRFLLPLFDPCSADYQPVWDGFLEKVGLCSHVAKVMKNLFRAAIPFLLSDFTDRRTKFVKHCTTMLIDYVDDPIIEWIPKLFDPLNLEPPATDSTPLQSPQTNRTAAELFAEEIGRRVWQMSAGDHIKLWKRWLKEHWQNRLDGVPVPMTSKEAKHMIDWLADLKDLFPEAVELAIQMLPASLENTRILASLAENHTWERHPEQVTRLVIYLCDRNVPTQYLDLVKDIVDTLISLDLSPELKLDLQDIRAQLPD